MTYMYARVARGLLADVELFLLTRESCLLCGLSLFSAGLATDIGRVGRQSMDGPQGLAGIALLHVDHWK
jgi:hypothetical protein